MIILCPKCSTGFNLPEKHITPRGAKLRCSKCSHVFRVRAGANDAPEVFYKPEDELANANAQVAAEIPQADAAKSFSAPRPVIPAEEEHDDRVRALGGLTNLGLSLREEDRGAAPGAPLPELSSPHHKTQFGSPGLAEVSHPNHRTLFGTASRALDDPGTMDLGPHVTSAPRGDTQFGLGAAASGPSKPVAAPKPALGKVGGALESLNAGDGGFAPVTPALDWRGASAGAGTNELDLFGGDDHASDTDDPFSGAFELSSSSAIERSQQRPGATLFEALSEEAPSDDILMPARPAAFAAAMVAPDAQIPSAQPAEPQLKREPTRLKSLPSNVPEPAPQNAQASMWGDGVFGADDMVDPSFGKDAPAFDPQRGVIVPPPAAAMTPPQGRPPVGRSAAPAIELARPPERVAPARASLPSPHVGLEPHQIGGSGPQKAANMALIVLSVLMLFLGVVAARNDMLIDFKRFGHMLQVGFGGETFQPRPEWLQGGAPAPAKAPSAVPGAAPAVASPLHIRDVWAQHAQISKRRDALLISGQLHNADSAAYVDVLVKAIVLDEQGEPLAEAEAPIGKLVSEAQLKGLGASKKPSSLLPEASARVEPGASAPFTVIVDEVPKAVRDGAPVRYRVEIIKQVSERELAP